MQLNTSGFSLHRPYDHVDIVYDASDRVTSAIYYKDEAETLTLQSFTITYSVDGWPVESGTEYKNNHFDIYLGRFVSQRVGGDCCGFATIVRGCCRQSFSFSRFELVSNTKNQVLIWPTTAETISIVSTSSDDDGAPSGTGIHTLLMTGTDVTGNEIQETITMNGLIPVVSIESYRRINTIESVTSGSNQTAVGNITFTNASLNLMDTISAGTSRSTSLKYSVPNGQIFPLKALRINADRIGEYEIKLMIFERVISAGSLLDVPPYSIVHTVANERSDMHLFPGELVLNSQVDVACIVKKKTGLNGRGSLLTVELFAEKTVDSAPPITGITLTPNTIVEDATINTVVGDLAIVGGTPADEHDEHDHVLFTIVSDVLDAFKIENNDELQLKTLGVLNYILLEGDYSITVRAVDLAGKSFNQALCIIITPETFTNVNSLEFNNGVDDEGMLAIGVQLLPLSLAVTDFTSSYWMIAPTPDAGSYSLLALETTGADFKLSITNRATATTAYRYRMQDDTVTTKQDYHTGNTIIHDSTLHHIIHTYNNTTNETKIYIDGVSVEVILTDALLVIGNTFEDIVIGNRTSNLPNTTRFNGKLNEICFWNKAMTSGDVTAIYNGGIIIDMKSRSDFANILAYYGCEEFVGGLMVDKAGKGHDLTPVNMDDSNFIAN